MSEKVLVVIAHSDDEVLGCGGALFNHNQLGHETFVLALSDGESSRAEHNTRQRYKCFENSCEILGITQHKQLSFDDSKLDSYPILDIIREIEKVKIDFNPTIIYTHSDSDINIDHQVTAKATLTAFRPTPESVVHKILTFEIPGSTQWGSLEQKRNFIPNYFVELSEKALENKIIAFKCYESEERSFPHPRSEEYIKSLVKIRGADIGVHYAEAFKAERVISRNTL